MKHRRFSFARSNFFQFRDGDLEIEICFHPLTGREIVTLNGKIVSEMRNYYASICYTLNFNNHAYTLTQGSPEDQSCRYFYELCRNGKPLQRYEIKANPKSTLPLSLLTLCLVIFLPVAASEVSANYMGISVSEWSTGVRFGAVVSSAFIAITIHLGILSHLIRVETRLGGNIL